MHSLIERRQAAVRVAAVASCLLLVTGDGDDDVCLVSWFPCFAAPWVWNLVFCFAGGGRNSRRLSDCYFLGVWVLRAEISITLSGPVGRACLLPSASGRLVPNAARLQTR